MLLSASICQQAGTMSAYKFTQRAVASPDAPQKPLVRKRARSGGAEWVCVTRRPAKQAKKPRTGGTPQPACSHEEHQILSTAEATAFAAQFWDCWFHRITWCVFIKGHSYNLCDAASRAMDRALHNVDYYYGLTDMAGLTIQRAVQNKQQFVRKLRILKRNDFWDVSKYLCLEDRGIGPPEPVLLLLGMVSCLTMVQHHDNGRSWDGLDMDPLQTQQVCTQWSRSRLSMQSIYFHSRSAPSLCSCRAASWCIQDISGVAIPVAMHTAELCLLLRMHSKLQQH